MRAFNVRAFFGVTLVIAVLANQAAFALPPKRAGGGELDELIAIIFALGILSYDHADPGDQSRQYRREYQQPRAPADLRRRCFVETDPVSLRGYWTWCQ